MNNKYCKMEPKDVEACRICSVLDVKLRDLRSQPTESYECVIGSNVKPKRIVLIDRKNHDKSSNLKIVKLAKIEVLPSQQAKPQLDTSVQLEPGNEGEDDKFKHEDNNYGIWRVTDPSIFSDDEIDVPLPLHKMNQSQTIKAVNKNVNLEQELEPNVKPKKVLIDIKKPRISSNFKNVKLSKMEVLHSQQPKPQLDTSVQLEPGNEGEDDKFKHEDNNYGIWRVTDPSIFSDDEIDVPLPLHKMNQSQTIKAVNKNVNLEQELEPNVKPKKVLIDIKKPRISSNFKNVKLSKMEVLQSQQAKPQLDTSVQLEPGNEGEDDKFKHEDNNYGIWRVTDPSIFSDDEIDVPLPLHKTNQSQTVKAVNKNVNLEQELEPNVKPKGIVMIDRKNYHISSNSKVVNLPKIEVLHNTQQPKPHLDTSVQLEPGNEGEDDKFKHEDNNYGIWRVTDPSIFSDDEIDVPLPLHKANQSQTVKAVNKNVNLEQELEPNVKTKEIAPINRKIPRISSNSKVVKFAKIEVLHSQQAKPQLDTSVQLEPGNEGEDDKFKHEDNNYGICRAMGPSVFSDNKNVELLSLHKNKSPTIKAVKKEVNLTQEFELNFAGGSGEIIQVDIPKLDEKKKIITLKIRVVKGKEEVSQKPNSSRVVKGTKEVSKKPNSSRVVKGTKEVSKKPNSSRVVKGKKEVSKKPNSSRVVKGTKEVSKKPNSSRVVKGKKEVSKKPNSSSGFKWNDLAQYVDVITLTLEEQKQAIQKRKESSNFLDSPFQCNLCYKGFIDNDTWKHHVSKHAPTAGSIECEVCKFRFKTKRAYNKHASMHRMKYVCKSCPYISTSMPQAKQHQGVHEGITYKCKFCDEVFTIWTSYMSHVRIKHPSEFICGFCGYSFVSKLGLTMHKSMMHKDIQEKETEIEIAEEEKPQEKTEDGLYCTECDIKFISAEAYRRHIVMSVKHTESTDSIKGCRTCGAMFENSEDLRLHNSQLHPRKKPKYYGMQASNMTWPIKCEHCPEVVASRREYWTHFRRAHPGENYPIQKNHICDICGKRFQSNTDLNYHMRKHSEDAKAWPSKCEHCPEVIASRREYWTHFRRAHPGEKYPIQKNHICDICGKGFQTNTLLNYHKRKHLEELASWPSKCEHCPEVIASRREYWTHFRRAHPDKNYPIQKNYICNICDKGFQTNTLLTQHRRTHSEERAYKCSQCGKAFHTRAYLSVHEKLHSDSRPFPCSVCFKAFKRKTALNRHFKIHTGEKPYECDICGKSFTQSNVRKLHVRTVHLKLPAPPRNRQRRKQGSMEPQQQFIY